MRADFPLEGAAPPRWLTLPMSTIYSWSAGRYHKSWDKRKQARAGVPVISIGNLAVGGTGKSPTVIALATLLREHYPALCEENAIAILSRGYGRLAKGVVAVEIDSDWQESGDEPLMIKRALPEVAVVVEEERTKGARHAVDKLGAKLILLDDGFQHRPIFRDLDLVMVDGEHPLGNGHLLPAGPLREKVEALGRAGALLSIGTDTAQAELLAERFSKPFLKLNSRTILPDELLENPQLRVFLVTGIARPERLYKMLKDKGIDPIGKLAFSDHHPFGPDDREAIYRTAKEVGAELVMTTAKDQVRMANWEYDLPLLTVGLQVDFESSSRVRELLEPILAKL
jgi:tetraacyldisaccharide 4'-kinase